MGRFQVSDDWAVGSVQLRGNSGFSAVLYRHDDVATIWRWVCIHPDHTTAEAVACGQAKLGVVGFQGA